MFVDPVRHGMKFVVFGKRRANRAVAGVATLALLAFTPVPTAVAAPEAATTSSGSFVFVKAGNVYLSNPQGSAQFQVTKDGTATDPYLSPSQDAQGVVYAVRGNQLFRFAQNGTQIAPPLGLEGGTGRGMVSPDGSTLAYQGVIPCGVNLCTSTRYRSLPAGGSLGLDLSFKEASWAGSNALGITAGDVWARQAGQTIATAWPLPDVPVGANGAGAAHNSVAANANGTRVATVSENLETGEAYLLLFAATGVGGSGLLFCGGTLPLGAVTSHPSFSSDGQTVIWDEPDGVWTMDVVDATPTVEACGQNIATARLLIPGGSAPSWSTAQASPQPIQSTPSSIDKSVQIRLVRWDAPGKDTDTNKSINGEFVKLVNTSKRPKSLKGYSLGDGRRHVYHFPDAIIKPGQTITVFSGRGKSTAKALYWGQRRHMWRNHRGKAEVRDTFNRVTDSVKWVKRGKGFHTFR